MLDELRTLSAVAETGSLQAAADRRCLTQSAVTRQMQRLEELLRLPLFDRRVKPLKLTRAGRDVLERGVAILASVETLKQSVRQGGQPSGPIRFGLAHGLSEPSFSHCVQQFKLRLPATLPSFVSDLSANHIRRVRSGECEAAIVLWDANTPRPPDLEARKVGCERMVVVAATSSVPEADEISHPETPWVVNPEGCLFRSKLSHWLQSNHGQKMRIAAEAHDTGLQAAFIAAGLGVGLISERVFHSQAISNLQIIDVPGLNLTAEVVVVRAFGIGSLATAVDVMEEEVARALRG